MIRIRVDKCNIKENDRCQSDGEIIRFFRNKYMLLVNNNIRFDDRYFGADSIHSEAMIRWLPVNTDT